MTRPLRYILASFSGAICVILSSAASAQTDVSVAEAQRLAYGLLERGQYGAALELVETLQQDGRNQTAVADIARSRALRGLNRPQEAVQVGRRAFRLANTPTEKFLAARSVAQAYSTGENRTMAQVWLRLESQYAPDESAHALNRRDFDYVRTRNPISLAFDLTVQPTDNINNAPTDNTITFLGITFSDPTLFPISGTNIQTETNLSYRLPATATRFSELRISHYGRRVILGNEADAIDPDLTTSDLSQDRISIAWGNNFRRADSNWVIDTTIAAYADWAAGAHIQNGLSVDVGYRLPVTQGQSLRIGGGLDSAARLDNALRSFDSWSAQIGWSGAFDGVGQLELAASFRDIRSESFAVAREQWGLSAVYALPIAVLTADLSIIARYGEAQYDKPLFGPDPRFDQTFSGTLAASLPQAEVFGFIPVVEFTHEQVTSNVTRFETDTTHIGFSIRSSF